MADIEATAGARQEAVQPSLWDRLVDDLPGLVAETEGMRRDLARRLGSADRVDRIAAGGPRAIEREPDLDDEDRLALYKYQRFAARRSQLEASGIVVSPRVLREAVRRDIEILFNTERLEADFLMTPHEAQSHDSPAALLARYPEVRRSVVNYGVPSFAGRSTVGTDFDPASLSREIREVLQQFEPRLRRDSVKVTVKPGKAAGLVIEIDAVLMLSPVPERLRLSTSIDLDNGQARTWLEDQ